MAPARFVWARPALVVGAIVFVAAAIAAWFSLKVVQFEPDELGYTHLAIGIANSHTPFTLSYGGSQRLNQLYPLLIAPFWGPFGNVTAFRLTHAWNALLMASAAIPAYLLARQVLRERWAAYLVAALVAAAPWLTLATAELTEVAAYPACVWALLAMQRSLVVPSWRRDVVALVAIAIAAYGRLQLIVLAPVLVIAMLVHELGYGLAAQRPRGPALREALARMARRHTVLSGSAAIGIAVGVPLLLTGKLASAAGFYGDTLTGATFNSATFDLARSYLTFIALGLGAVPAALAFGFVLQAIVAPASRHAHAFASITLITVIALTLQVAEISVRFNGATVQERYLFYIAPLLALGMCGALLASRRPLVAIAIGSLAAALLLGSTHYVSSLTAFWYQVSPGMASFYDWLGPAFGARGGPTVAAGAATLIPAGAAVLGAGLLLALLVWWLGGVRVVVPLAGCAIVFCAVETTHALWSVVHGNKSGSGLGTGSLHGVDWVDSRVPAGAKVSQLADNLGGLAVANVLWETNAFWNRSITSAYTVDEFDQPYLPTVRLSVDARTGRLVRGRRISSRYTAPAQVGRYMVLASRGFPMVPVGVVMSRSPDRQLELMRLAEPMRAAWLISGVSPDGWLKLHGPAILHVFSLGAGRGGCGTVTAIVGLSAVLSAAQQVTLSSAGSRARVLVQPGARRSLALRVCGRPGVVPRVALAATRASGKLDPGLGPHLLSLAVRSG